MALERDLGMDALRRGDFETAIEHLEQSRRETPNDFQVLFCLSGAYHQTKRDAEAVQILSEALALRPYDAHVHYNLGICLDRVRRRREAIAALQCALALQPEYPLARHVLQRWSEEEQPQSQEPPTGGSVAAHILPSSPTQSTDADRPSSPKLSSDKTSSMSTLSPQETPLAQEMPPPIPNRRPRRRPINKVTGPYDVRADLPRDAQSNEQPNTPPLSHSTSGSPAEQKVVRQNITTASVSSPIMPSPPLDGAKTVPVPERTELSPPEPRRTPPANHTSLPPKEAQTNAVEPTYLQESVPCPLAVEALKLSIGSLFLVGIFLGPMAISRGIEARRWIAESPYWTGDEIALAAIVLGALGMLLSCVELIILFLKI